jgi:hypothetical protein
MAHETTHFALLATNEPANEPMRRRTNPRLGFKNPRNRRTNPGTRERTRASGLSQATSKSILYQKFARSLLMID